MRHRTEVMRQRSFIQGDLRAFGVNLKKAYAPPESEGFEELLRQIEVMAERRKAT
jgi:hypothetical protein